MPAPESPAPEVAPGTSRSTTVVLAEADRLLVELPAQIEAAKQERERAARLRKRLSRPAAPPRRPRS
jgi:hypothetical protein